MKCQTLELKGNEGVVGLHQGSKDGISINISGCAMKISEVAPVSVGTRENDVAAYTQRFQELALIPKTLDFAIELANDLMDQKLRTYTERHNENKRKAEDSSRNNHQQQSNKRKNKSILGTYLCAPSAITTILGNVHPSVEKCKRYDHATTYCRVNTNNNNSNNNNKNQKGLVSLYECGNTGYMRRDCPKLKNRGNGNGNGTAQGRAYALGGRDASPDSNVITGMDMSNIARNQSKTDTRTDE
ncbi:hypothetical protein Tco_0766280 [Tanacetum coccineum]